MREGQFIKGRTIVTHLKGERRKKRFPTSDRHAAQIINRKIRERIGLADLREDRRSHRRPDQSDVRNELLLDSRSWTRTRGSIVQPDDHILPVVIDATGQTFETLTSGRPNARTVGSSCFARKKRTQDRFPGVTDPLVPSERSRRSCLATRPGWGNLKKRRSRRECNRTVHARKCPRLNRARAWPVLMCSCSSLPQGFDSGTPRSRMERCRLPVEGSSTFGLGRRKKTSRRTITATGRPVVPDPESSCGSHRCER